MGTRHCAACFESPVTTCGRCMAPRCVRHALRPGERCAACERDYREEARARRAVKLMFAPPVGLLTGGLLLGLLMPVSLGALGAVATCALISGLAVGAGAGTCSLVERTSRAMFLRERAGGLPAARLLTPGKR
ncbi:MAG TPA: hypothetical protein VGG74_37900 [Kofleriaceae bacterium]